MFTPRTLEDKLIYKYWEEKQGLLFLEVPIGNDKNFWPKDSKIRRIDGIRVEDNENQILKTFNLENFKNIIKNKNIELLEAKKTLNRLVIGQIIVGIEMFKKQYESKKIKGVILCKEDDPALEIICKEMGIEVVVLN